MWINRTSTYTIWSLRFWQGPSSYMETHAPEALSEGRRFGCKVCDRPTLANVTYSYCRNTNNETDSPMVVTERISSWHCKDLALRVSNNFSRLNSPLLNSFERSGQQQWWIRNPLGGCGCPLVELFSNLATSCHLPSYSWPPHPEMSVSSTPDAVKRTKHY